MLKETQRIINELKAILKAYRKEALDTADIVILLRNIIKDYDRP